MPAGVALAVLVATASCLVGGTALVAGGRARLTGMLLAAGGLLLLAGALVGATGSRAAGRALLVVAVHSGIAALLAYPRLELRRTVDLAAVVVVVAAPVSLVPVVAHGSITAVGTVADAVLGTGFLVLVLHTWWRLERAEPALRRTLLWMALPSGLAALVSAVASFAVGVRTGGGTDATAVVTCSAVALVPPSLWTGVARPQLVDVRTLVVRSAVAVGTVVVVVSAFATAASVLELLAGSPVGDGALALLAGVLALAVPWVRTVLHDVVEAVLLGERPDPLLAVEQVLGTLGDEPSAALGIVRDALALPGLALELDGVEATSSGGPAAGAGEVRPVRLPVAGVAGAELVVHLRPLDLRLPAGDGQVLRLVAPLLVQAVRSRAAAEQVRTSREATVRAVEEERRRLRRDLHDGLGPTLSGIGFTADAARNCLPPSADAADRLLAQLREEVGAAIADIRRLVYGMRPPALDELGLVGALERHAHTLQTAGDGLTVVVEAGSLPPLPAAVEVAAYRIAVSALDNVGRHAAASSAEVRLSAGDGELRLEVVDPGRLDRRTGTWVPGVGTASMRERAAELGGTLVTGPSGSGWRVAARLPLPTVAEPVAAATAVQAGTVAAPRAASTIAGRSTRNTTPSSPRSTSRT